MKFPFFKSNLKHLLNTYYVSGIVPSSVGTVMNEKGRGHTP